MQLIAIEVQDFKALVGHREYQDIPTGIIGITGDNGKGKSTLMTAVAYAFYGPDVIETGNADIVSWGAKEAKVSVWFEMDGVPYQITRRSDGKNSSATLSRVGEPIAQSATEVTQEISRLLGIDRVGFLASVFSQQEDLLGIGSLQPAKRQSTVLRLLGIDQVDGAIKKLGEENRNLNRDLNITRLTVQPPEDGPSEEDIAKLEDRLESIGSDMHSFEQAISDAAADLKDIEASVETYNKWANEVTYVRSQIQARVEQYQDLMRKATVKLPDEPKRPDPFLEPEEYEQGMRDYMAAKKAAEQSVCPTCKRPYDEAETIEVSAQAEHWQAWVDKWASIGDNSRAYLVNHEGWERMRKTQQDELEQASIIKTERLTPLRDRLSELEAKALENPQKPYSAGLAALSKYKESRNKLAVEQAGLQSELSHAKRALAERERARRVYSEHKARINEMERLVLVMNHTTKLMTEFKAALIANVVPSITSKASALVTEMTEGKYTEISLTPQYDIEYRNDQGDLKSFANLSGGEKDVFALSLRLSIADIKAGSVGFLVLDEVLESLDSDRQQATWESLQRLSSRYNQIFVITHVDAFKDRAEYSLSV